MSALRQAIDEYLGIRRDLGFKLKDAQRGLLEFSTFMEQHQAPFITEVLALACRDSVWMLRTNRVRYASILHKRSPRDHGNGATVQVHRDGLQSATIERRGRRTLI